MSKATKKTPMAKNSSTASKVRIKMKSYDYRVLDEAFNSIQAKCKLTGSGFCGFPLPSKTTYLTLLRSPHVDKKSREQFQCKTHKRLIEISSPTATTIEALKNLDLPAGVDIEIKAN